MPSEFIERQKNDLIRDISSFGSLFAYVVILAVFLIQKNYYLFAKLATGLVLIYAIVILIRSVYFKERPKKYPHHTFIERLDASSFPSLHAIRTSFLAAILISYFNSYLFSIIAAILLVIIAYSRIYLKKHDKIDVLVGILVGVGVYFAVEYIV